MNASFSESDRYFWRYDRNSELENFSPPNEHFPISLDDDESKLNSDDGAETNKKGAFKRILIYPQSLIIGRKRAISVMAVEVDNHRKKGKILSECALTWTPEEVNIPQTNLTMLPTTSAELYNSALFRTSPEYVMPNLTIIDHHKALIRRHICLPEPIAVTVIPQFMLC